MIAINATFLKLFATLVTAPQFLQFGFSIIAKRRLSIQISAYICKFYFIASATATATATVAPTMGLLPKKFTKI